MQIAVKNGGFFDRAISRMGLVRSSQIRSQAFTAGGYNRLTWDWATAILSADLEIRASLYALRARSRDLARNNAHALRFINSVRQNVIGCGGFTIEVAFEDAAGSAAENIAQAIELSWARWSRRVTTDTRLSLIDASNLWLESLIKDGEVFVRKVRGYPHNDFGFALEFIDPDRVDWTLDRVRSVGVDGFVQNQIRMGVEIDEWRRPVGYHILETHPTDIGPKKRVFVPAGEIDHAYLFRRPQQTRGVPFLHACMASLNMLGCLEEAELVASRLEACKMGFFTSKTGDEYTGKHEKKTGQIEMEATPGHFEQLPEGVDFKDWNANHPNTAFPEFQRSLLRGIAMGAGCSYATISGDLRDVNFSSLRQGVLEERDGWRVLQSFANQHFLEALVPDWLSMALLSGELRVPPPPSDQSHRYLQAITFTPRGWTWVDPFKDIQADVMAMRAGLQTAKAVCGDQGLDYREVYRQRAKEVALAKELGLEIDLGGAGERAPLTSGEGETVPASPAPKPAPAAPPQRKNGKAANADFPEVISTLRGVDPEVEVQ